jgi:uncharacterized protein (PEP-CTERM system associated)
VAWLSAVLLALFALPVRAQYDLGGPGSLGVGKPDIQKEPGALGIGKRGLQIQPRLLVEETYTDNLRLAPAGSERSDWVTRLRPGVSVTSNGARARFNATYSPEVVYRAQEGSNDVYHYLNANGNAELVQQLLFLDAQANITQQNISVLGPQAQSNINDTGNRTSVRSYSVSPYLRHNFGYDAQGEARLTHDAVSTSSNTLSDSEANRIDMRLSSGPAFKLLTWYLAYNKEQIEYTQTGQKIDTERISAGGRRLITPNLGLRANVGYEDNNYNTAGPAPKGAFWSLGPEWNPTPRTHFAATAGRRYYGPTRSLDFNHRTRLTTWSVNYSEDVTTTRSQVLVPTTVDTAGYLDALFLSAIPDPVTRRTVVENFISRGGLPPSLTVPLNFFTTTPFLEKRWLASFGIQGVRNTVLTSVFRQTRDATATGQPGAGDFTLSQNTRQTGVSLLWILRIAPQTTSNASAGYTRNEFPGLSREENLKFIRLGLTRQFQPRLSGTLSFHRLQNDSDQSGGSYTENAVSAALNMGF